MAQDGSGQRTIDRLAKLVELPRAWAGQSAQEVVDELADVLADMLALDAVHLRLLPAAAAAPVERVRSAGSMPLPPEIGSRFAAWLGADPTPDVVITSTDEAEGALRLAIVPFALDDAAGLVIAASARPDFPTPDELILTRMALDLAVLSIRSSHAVQAERASAHAAQETIEILETVNGIGRQLVGQHDLESLVQFVIDEATRLTGAQLGAFFYNVPSEHGDPATLCALAGVSTEAFARSPIGRRPEAFSAAFGGDRIVRSPHAAEEPRDGETPIHLGIPDLPPMASHLAVPVVSRSGEVYGALFFGHAERGKFSARMESIIAGVAAQTAIAMDNVRLLEQEQRARRAAESANRSKEEFLAVLSHELRTPLNAVYGWASMLRSGQLEGADQVQRALDVIMRNANAQVQLIDDLLDISRITAGKMRLDVRAVDLKAVIEAAMDAMRPAADARGVRLVHVLDPRATSITGDPDRLQQVVWNLLSNAVKFTPRDGRVEVRLERHEAHVDIVVRDTGQGIPSELLPHIFERFRQGDASATRPYQGLGLGLALVRYLVELHGGQVRAESPGVGQGATFTVTLPIAVARSPADEEGGPRPVSATLPLTAGPSLDDVRVLVVDDDRDSRELIEAILREAGAAVRACGSAREGFGVLREWRPHVLISDIEMPGEDGYAFIRRVRALGPSEGAKIPAVALSAYGRVEDRLRTLAAGFSMHVPKPVEPAELVVIVSNLAGR